MKKERGALFRRVLRGCFVALGVLFCAVLAFMHFCAWTKVGGGMGLKGLLLVDESTQCHYAVWSFVDARRWIGVCYGFLLLASLASIGRPRSFLAWISWLALPMLLGTGLWYLSLAAHLFSKIILVHAP